MPPTGSCWDFFLVHASADHAYAEALYTLLSRHRRVFLDTQKLRPGDAWDADILAAFESSAAFVVLVSAHLVLAHYAREEIVRAVNLHRAGRARVIPVWLDTSGAGYGLEVFQGFRPAGRPDQVARALLGRNRRVLTSRDAVPLAGALTTAIPAHRAHDLLDTLRQRGIPVARAPAWGDTWLAVAATVAGSSDQLALILDHAMAVVPGAPEWEAFLEP